MSERYHNPFQGIDISVPTEFREEFSMYCQTGGKSIIDKSPFPRLVDLWFSAICVAARLGIPPAYLTGQDTYKIIEGSILSNDPWRFQALMLLAVALTEGIDVVDEPRRMMSIANGLAVSGLPHLIDMLKDGEAEPIWNLSEGMESLIKKGHP